MDEVLFLSYYFPPVGGAGVQRSLKFCRYLPEAGIRPVVVAGPRRSGGRWEPLDASLARELAPDLPVYRPAGDPPDDGTGRWDRLLARPGPRHRWWQEELYETGLLALARHAPRAIYVSLSPFEGLEPALALARRSGLPLLADLRDPWALDEVRVYPSALHRRIELGRMRKLLARCQRVLWNTPEALRVACSVFPSLRERFHCLTNGFDAADFEGGSTRPPDGRFRIVHSGYLHARRAVRRPLSPSRWLGGELCPIDFLGRSHFYLLRALERIASRSKALAERIEVLLVGVLSPEDEALVLRSSVAPLLRLVGYLEHPSTVAAQMAADLLFLPMHGLPPGRRARIVPAKTYEYLASGRPILAAVPEGDARDLVVEARAGRIVEPADVEGLARAIELFAGEAPAPRRPPEASLRSFERRVLTQELARHLREVF